MKNKYYDIIILFKAQYEISYISSINNYKYSLTTCKLQVALYEYLKALAQSHYNLKIFMNNNDITEKINKLIEKLNKMIEKL